MAIYPKADTSHQSIIRHDNRPQTLGVVLHWTAGHEAGDVFTLTRSGNVDVQFYVTKKGKVYQFMDSDSQAWHAMGTANRNTVGIETEGSGEPWTSAQTAAIVDLSAWLVKQYGIPVKHAQPRSQQLDTFRGFMGHGDLSKGGVDGNDHSDTVPSPPGWDAYLARVDEAVTPHVRRYYFEIPALGDKAKWGPYKSKLVRTIRRKAKEITTGFKAREYSQLERV